MVACVEVTFECHADYCYSKGGIYRDVLQRHISHLSHFICGTGGAACWQQIKAGEATPTILQSARAVSVVAVHQLNIRTCSATGAASLIALSSCEMFVVG